jgi:hypothetical protein
MLAFQRKNSAETEQSERFGLRFTSERGEHRLALLPFSCAEQRIGQPHPGRQVLRANLHGLLKVCDGILRTSESLQDTCVQVVPFK